MRRVDEQNGIWVECLAHGEPEWRSKLLIFDQLLSELRDVFQILCRAGGVFWPAVLWLAKAIRPKERSAPFALQRRRQKQFFPSIGRCRRAH